MYTVRVKLHRFMTFFDICVNLTGEEFAKLDKVISNQTYAESKSRIMSAIVYQHATTIWPSATPDDVTMRTLGAWAICQYRCNGNWLHGLFSCLPCFDHLKKEVRLHLTKDKSMITKEVALALESQTSKKEEDDDETKPPKKKDAPPSGMAPPEYGLPTKLEVASGAVGEDPRVKVLVDLGFTRTAAVKQLLGIGPPRNKLGYVELGHGNDDMHPLGGRNAEDTEIRVDRRDRVVIKDAGIGIVGQSTDPLMHKQIVGVVGLPISFGPNVYAKEAANIDVAIDQRITRKQRPFTANGADRALIGRFVKEAIGNNPHRSVFSQKRIMQWWENTVFADLRSGKWTEQRLTTTVEGLCRRIDPKFKLSADIKLEGMPEGKAPRMLIADGDEGQVLALLTICCLEDLIKKHMPNKTIKGIGKREAMKRVAAELRVPKGSSKKTKKSDWNGPQGKASRKGCTVFEGDGSAWDTTCSEMLRDCVENPVIIHIACTLKALMCEPDSWVDSHADISVLEKITLTFKKNGEFRKFIIDAIRRSGHRGTSCLNWWVNFTCWHCAIFEQPEIFLDPSVRYGKDHSGIMRWLASAFEGDDSILSTSPAIKESDEIYVSIIQRWIRFGFNMEIFIREDKALFTGYKLAVDNSGPTGVIMPEVDRCFGRGGISCSTSMIQGFKDDDAKMCQSISKSAALSRAYEFAGLSPTISTKYLRYYESINTKTCVDRELLMRTTGELESFSEPDIIADINIRNGAAMSFDSSERDRLAATGFQCSEEELSQFSLRTWEYSLLHDWEGFRESLPLSWRAK